MADKPILTTGALSERTISSFPLSIGTGLAFESLLDPVLERYDTERPIPKRVDLQSYHAFWINVSTLFRNMLTALPKENLSAVTGEEFAEAITTEIEIIKRLLPMTPTRFYFPSYQSLYDSKDPNIRIRQSTTFNQQRRAFLLAECKAWLAKFTEEIVFLDDTLYPLRKERALILTHTPYDLLSYPQFSRLELLESHTGILKPKSQWYTKFYGLPGYDLRVIPFVRSMLLTFGDHVMFHPASIKIRQQIVEIAKKQHWTYATTPDRVKLELEIFHAQ